MKIICCIIPISYYFLESKENEHGKHLLTFIVVSGSFFFKSVCLTKATSKLIQEKDNNNQVFGISCFISLL